MNPTGRRISILLPDLGGGGAERLHVNLANDWVSRGYSVEIILCQRYGDLFELLAPEITIKVLKAGRLRLAVWPLLRHLRKSRPDIVIAAMWPLTSIAIFAWLLAGKPGRMYVSNHTQITAACVNELKISVDWVKAIMRMTYRYADGVIAVSQGVKADLLMLAGLRDDQVKVIYNPVATGVSQSRKPLQERERLWGREYRYHILSVGRLKVQKDHATLIRAFALLPEDFGAKLVILGDGELRAELSELVEQLGLTQRVEFPGFQRDPYPWFLSADLFVLSSRWEGFGNVIVEALECGVPVISTDCQSGPAEILEDGRYGVLVPVADPFALAEAIKLSFDRVHDRADLMQRAQDFSINRISEQYLEYLFAEDN